LRSPNPITRLRVKLARTARALRSWSKEHFGDATFQLHLTNEIILRLDLAQENRCLSDQEFCLRKSRQASCISSLREGDANTRYFHVKMNSRRRKNFVHALAADTTIATSHPDKERVLFDHFSVIMGTSIPRTRSLSWEDLNLSMLPVNGLDQPFTAKEIWDAIMDSPADKAPGPDGFNDVFYRRCWGIIRPKVMDFFQHVYNIAGGDFTSLYRALVCLLPKTTNAPRASDFSPIRLIHSTTKLFSNVLARRLSPVIGRMVSPAQSAFLKGRTLHDNFVYV
jgi:hypothetical protein